MTLDQRVRLFHLAIIFTVLVPPCLMACGEEGDGTDEALSSFDDEQMDEGDSPYLAQQSESLLANGRPDDHGDTSSQARPIRPGQAIQGRIDVHNDEDWLWFLGDARRPLFVRVDGAQSCEIHNLPQGWRFPSLFGYCGRANFRVNPAARPDYYYVRLRGQGGNRYTVRLSF